MSAIAARSDCVPEAAAAATDPRQHAGRAGRPAGGEQQIAGFNRCGIRAVVLLAMFAIAAASVSSSPAPGTGANADAASGVKAGKNRMKIRISLGTANIEAVLEDNPTARDFAAQLPLTLTLRDFGTAEKVSGELPRRLSEEGAPATVAGALGDIAYYAPWGNIAFYRGRGPDAPGVIKIATITVGIEALDQRGSLRASISRVE